MWADAGRGAPESGRFPGTTSSPRWSSPTSRRNARVATPSPAGSSVSSGRRRRRPARPGARARPVNEAEWTDGAASSSMRRRATTSRASSRAGLGGFGLSCAALRRTRATGSGLRLTRQAARDTAEAGRGERSSARARTGRLRARGGLRRPRAGRRRRAAATGGRRSAARARAGRGWCLGVRASDGRAIVRLRDVRRPSSPWRRAALSYENRRRAPAAAIAGVDARAMVAAARCARRLEWRLLGDLPLSLLTSLAKHQRG